jgi:hypothetical protein
MTETTEQFIDQILEEKLRPTTQPLNRVHKHIRFTKNRFSTRCKEITGIFKLSFLLHPNQWIMPPDKGPGVHTVYQSENQTPSTQFYVLILCSFNFNLPTVSPFFTFYFPFSLYYLTRVLSQTILTDIPSPQAPGLGEIFPIYILLPPAENHCLPTMKSMWPLVSSSFSNSSGVIRNFSFRNSSGEGISASRLQ